jgi:hypothetical protein
MSCGHETRQLQALVSACIRVIKKLKLSLIISCVSAFGSGEVGFYCDRLGKHYSKLILPKFWINYADSTALVYMQAHAIAWRVQKGKELNEF